MLISHLTDPWRLTWASLVAQMVKNLPGVQFLGWEDPLEKGMVTDFSILARRNLWTLTEFHGLGGYSAWG